jgi:hypothetical protein
MNIHIILSPQMRESEKSTSSNSLRLDLLKAIHV